jgi:hypothetical protein
MYTHFKSGYLYIMCIHFWHPLYTHTHTHTVRQKKILVIFIDSSESFANNILVRSEV